LRASSPPSATSKASPRPSSTTGPSGLLMGPSKSFQPKSASTTSATTSPTAPATYCPPRPTTMTTSPTAPATYCPPRLPFWRHTSPQRNTLLYMNDSSLSPAQTQVVEGGCELHQGSSPHVDYMVLAPSRLLRFPNPQQANVPSTTTALARSSALRVKPLTDTWLFHSSMAIQVDMLSSQLMTVSLLSL